MKTYFIKTFGCAMNYSDSERIVGFLEDKGYKVSSDISEADLVIFNTCGVRQMAEDRVYGQIHNLAKRKTQDARFDKLQARRAKHELLIILTGCLANRKDVQRRLKNKVDLFTSIKDFPENIKKLLQVTSYELRVTKSNEKSLNDYFHIKPKLKNKFSALVPIMTGCNNFCSYCVVPYARGREVSRPAEEIIAEVKDLVKKGYKQIILLGQNVNSYHVAWNMKHETKEVNFSELLRKIDKISGKFWINFVSNHPKDVTDEMIETVAKCKKVCEIFHLPIQAGNDRVLKNMNRRYTTKEYLILARKIKSAFKKNKPDIPAVITSDIIVGFPGETKKQFMDSAELMKKVSFDMVYFGQFSPRPGTAAWNMKDNVSKKEKSRREQFLNEILKKSALKNSRKFLNTTTEVLIEKKSDSAYFGKTRTGKNVKIISNKKNLIGKIIRVKIIKANIWNLEGEF